MHELFEIPFKQNQQSVSNVVTNTHNVTCNVQELHPNLASVAPRMVFQNSSITINFNVSG